MAETRQLSAAPSLPEVYSRVVRASARPLLGRLPGTGPDGRGGLPGLELSLAEVQIDRAHLTAYDRVCGFRLRDELPPTYLHVVAFPLSMLILTDPGFPLPVIGLLHVRNRIEHLRPLRVSERPSVRVWTDNLSHGDRGTEFEVMAEATVAGSPVWRSSSTYLSRRGGGGGSKRRRTETAAREPSAVWRLAADTGRRYAAVSGDRNPIHLHPLTARLFGLPQPIAHGMWLKARCLAALEGSLQDGYEIDVSFKLPVPLPGRVGFSSWREGTRHSFSLEDGRGRPHLTGAIAPG